MTFKMVPVLGGSVDSPKLIKKYGRYVPFYPKSLAKVDRVLVNFHYQKQVTRDMFHRGMKTIYADSGGLQMITQGEKLDPTEVMKWQNPVCDIAIGLDHIPVRRPADGGKLSVEQVKQQQNEFISPDFFKKCAEKTAVNLNKMLRVKDEKVKLFATIHGVTFAQRKLWFKTITKDHEYEGYTLKGSSFMQATTACSFMHDFIGAPVHILGVGRIARSAPYCYWSKHWKYPLTADSTSWDQGTFYRRWDDPVHGYQWALKDPARKWKKGQLGQRDLIWPHKGLPCSCIWCEEAKDFKMKNTELGILMSSHNLWRLLETQKKLMKLARVPEMFIQDAERMSGDDEGTTDIGWDKGNALSVRRVVKALDLIPEKGGEWVARKYCQAGRQEVEQFF